MAFIDSSTINQDWTASQRHTYWDEIDRLRVQRQQEYYRTIYNNDLFKTKIISIPTSEPKKVIFDIDIYDNPKSS